MQVCIDSKYHDFDAKFNPHKRSDNGWEKQAQDSFKISNIGGKKVFIKRFEEKPKGYQFLVKLKNKKFSSLPMIYDWVSQEEDGNKVFYLFQECVEGKTFYELMHDGILHFHPQKFLKNIYDALKIIADNGYWYTDFVEKNIFVSKNGDFYLIDLDSVAPLSTLPNDVRKVSEEYKIAVRTYWYRDTFNYPFTYIRQNLRGDTINFLELFHFVAQIKYYVDNISSCDFLDEKTRKAIPQYLLDRNNGLTYAVFKSCFADNSNHQQIPSFALLEGYVNKILFPEKQSFKIDFNQGTTTYAQKTSNGTSTKKANDVAEQLKKANEEKLRKEKKERIERLITAITNNIASKDYSTAESNIRQIFSLDPSNITVKNLQETLSLEKQKDKQLVEEAKRRKIVELNNKKGSWFVALLAHIFGCGLYYVDKSLKRHYLYISALIYAIIDFYLAAVINLEPFTGDFGLVTILIALFTTYGIGTIDVLITNYNKNEKINKQIKMLQS